MEKEKAAKDMALSLFMALRTYLPQDKERTEWILRTMEKSFSKAQDKGLEEAAKLVEETKFFFSEPLVPPPTEDEIVKAYGHMAEHLAKNIRALSTKPPTKVVVADERMLHEAECPWHAGGDCNCGFYDSLKVQQVEAHTCPDCEDLPPHKICWEDASGMNRWRDE